MVSITVSQQDSVETRADGHGRLRRSALWYPDVPPPLVSLNEDFFIPLQSYTWGYRPLFWTRFGGPGGSYLSHLTKVTASWAGGLLRMDFSFDREVPDECRRFGRHEDSENERVIEFLVDGPGGEVIDQVEVWQQYPSEREYVVAWSRQKGKLACLKVSTNRGRMCEFGRKPNSRSKPVIQRKVSAPQGMAITGVFGAQVCIIWPRPFATATKANYFLMSG